MNNIYSTEPISEMKISAKRIIHPWIAAGKPQKFVPTVTFPKQEPQKNNIQLGALLEIVCKEFGIELFDIAKETRERRFVEPRQAYYYLAKTLTKASLQKIAQTIPLNQHHTSLIHSIRTVQNEIDTKSDFGVTVTNLLNKLS